MADEIKFSELPNASTPLAGTEIVALVQDGTSKKVAVSEIGGGGGADWGQITGTLSNQTDLQNALNSKVGSYASNHPINGYISANGQLNVGIEQASPSSDGYLSIMDYQYFATKQDGLVSGANIKTINGSSILGSGNLTVAGGGGNVIPVPPVTGLYYMTTACMNFTDGHSLWTNELTFHPFIPMNNLTVNQFNIEVTQSAAGQSARVVIYSDLNGKPSSKLYESANIDISTTGYKTVTMSYSFTAGTLYWIGIQANGNNGRLRAVLNTNTMLSWSVASTTSTSYSTLIYTALIFNSLPATIPPATIFYQGNGVPFVLKFRSA